MKGTAQYNNDTLFFLHYSRNKTIIAVLLKERRDDWNVLASICQGVKRRLWIL
jgi:hypothetical protein